MTELPDYDDDQQGMFRPVMAEDTIQHREKRRMAKKPKVPQTQLPRGLPDFKSHAERDAYFRDHADYYTLVKKAGVGVYDRSEFRSLAEAENAAQVRALAGSRGWLIYAVIGEQSALVKAIK